MFATRVQSLLLTQGELQDWGCARVEGYSGLGGKKHKVIQKISHK